MTVSGISLAIGGRLASVVVSSAGPRLKRSLLGSEEQRAIREAFRAAFTATLAEITLQDAPPEIEPLISELEEFFADPQVCDALVDVALSRQQPDVESLRGQLWAVGLDPTTFPVDLAEFLRRVSVHLAVELRRHAARQASPIFNEVALAELDHLCQQLERLAVAPRESDIAPAAGQAPRLPALVVGRDKALRDIKARIGIPGIAGPPRRTQVITAVRGWPGVGKTTLVSAIAHDPEVVQAFPDGVLWAALPDSDRVAVELAGWARALEIGGWSPASSVAELSSRLRAALRDKRMLLLLDDVWELRDAEPFLVGGRGCARLVTTRVSAVAAALAPTPADVYRLDILDDDSGVELLERLAPSVVTQHRVAALELVREVEGLPLALQVAGHQLHAQASMGFGVEQLLDELRQGAKLLESDAPADRIDVINQTTPTVAALLSQSTNRLSIEDRERFALLGAFAPKPATFSVDALVDVWETTDPVPTVRTLVQRGLLEPIGGRRFQMHALLALHARCLLEN